MQLNLMNFHSLCDYIFKSGHYHDHSIDTLWYISLQLKRVSLSNSTAPTNTIEEKSDEAIAGSCNPNGT